METPLGTAAAQPIRGYSRAEVDDFLDAAARERSRLETEIADADRRVREARSAIGMHRVMVAMVLDAQRELTEVRRAAEREADAIIAAAELDAQQGVSAAPIGPVTHMVDLTAAEESPATVAESGSDEYFEFLRGALADDGPLGPSPE